MLEAIHATELHLVVSCVAMGILPGISLGCSEEVPLKQLRYQRTPARGRISEASVMHYLRNHFFRLLGKSPELRITQIIQEKQDKSEIYKDFLAS